MSDLTMFDETQVKPGKSTPPTAEERAKIMDDFAKFFNVNISDDIVEEAKEMVDIDYYKVHKMALKIVDRINTEIKDRKISIGNGNNDRPRAYGLTKEVRTGLMEDIEEIMISG